MPPGPEPPSSAALCSLPPTPHPHQACQALSMLRMFSYSPPRPGLCGHSLSLQDFLPS